jgi:transposase
MIGKRSKREDFWFIVARLKEAKMRQKAGPQKPAAEHVIKDIRRATRKHHSAEDKIRIVLEGLRGEESIAALCRREGIAESLYYTWSKEFLEAGKKRLAGDTARAATSDEVKVCAVKRAI